ncbi:MAG: hypothetical protein IJ501_05670 [Bacilli bacterium]|nr:hypothetical protein [Bacilli bacterium]
MNLEFCVNEYLLAWYLLYSASLSKEIDKFRKILWSKYKKEYNFCYKDKQEIIKYGKDFIPDNDIIYNEIFKSDLYVSLKKETEKHKMHLVKLFNSDSKTLKKCVKEVLKLNLKDTYPVYVIHPRMECIEYNSQNASLIWGSDKDKFDALTILILTIVKGMYEEYNDDYKEIISAIIELAVINEISKKLTNTETYDLGDKTLRIVKRQIYPFWLMYLGNDTKEDLLRKMIEDKIAFDIDHYPIDKNMKKMNLTEFIDFCIKNNRHILKLGNVLKIEREEEIEVI